MFLRNRRIPEGILTAKSIPANEWKIREVLCLIFSIVIWNLGKAWIQTHKLLSSWKRILPDLWYLCLNEHFFNCISN